MPNDKLFTLWLRTFCRAPLCGRCSRPDYFNANRGFVWARKSEASRPGTSEQQRRWLILEVAGRKWKGLA